MEDSNMSEKSAKSRPSNGAKIKPRHHATEIPKKPKPEPEPIKRERVEPNGRNQRSEPEPVEPEPAAVQRFKL